MKPAFVAMRTNEDCRNVERCQVELAILIDQMFFGIDRVPIELGLHVRKVSDVIEVLSIDMIGSHCDVALSRVDVRDGAVVKDARVLTGLVCTPEKWDTPPHGERSE